jgi:hypothetical protein
MTMSDPEPLTPPSMDNLRVQQELRLKPSGSTLFNRDDSEAQKYGAFSKDERQINYKPSTATLFVDEQVDSTKKEGANETFIVDWDGPDDPEDPKKYVVLSTSLRSVFSIH